MLDDLKIISERDKSDALGVAEKQWQQLQYEFNVELPKYDDIQNVVIAGMGGSALPAVFLQSWPGLNVPLEIVRTYDIPQYVGKNTLYIGSSYSGNTEETLSTLNEAEQRGAQIVVVSAGGKLTEYAKRAGHPLFAIPSGFQPRMSMFYFWAAFVQILEHSNLAKLGGAVELADVGNWLKEQTQTWRPDSPVSGNFAKQLALELVGKSIVIYGGSLMWPVANKWKISFNENSKQLAWANQLPEFDHNEFIGWSGQPVDKPYAVVDIRSSLEHPRIQKRFEVSERLLSGMRPAPQIVSVQGENILQQLLWGVTLGDFVSIYLAILNNVDPTPVELVEKFKKALDQ